MLNSTQDPNRTLQKTLCYVMWNLCYVEFTVGSIQFSNDSTIASLEANQNRPKIIYYVNK